MVWGDTQPRTVLSFFHNRTYKAALEATRAGAVLITAAQADAVPKATLALVVDHPYRGFGMLAALFYPEPAQGGRSTSIPKPR